MEKDVPKFQFGRAVAGGHETAPGPALSSDSGFELLKVVDDRREVGTEDGIDGTDAETRPLDVGEGGRGVGGPTPGGVAGCGARRQ